MKNLTEGEKMVWAAVFAANIEIFNGIIRASIKYADNAVVNLRNELEDSNGDKALETAKEVLK